MSNTLEFKITITDNGQTIGEIDLFSFSETEVYAMYSGKGLNKQKATAHIKQLKKLLRRAQIAPNSNIQTVEKLFFTRHQQVFAENSFPNIVPPSPVVIDSIAADAVKAILADDYALFEKIIKGNADIAPQPIASRANQLLKGISSHRENLVILTPSPEKAGCRKLRQRIDLASLPEKESPQILHSFAYERRELHCRG